MSRVVTPPAAQPFAGTVKVPHEKIALRAYEKWVKKGCRHGSDVQDWVEAESELKAEMVRASMTAPHTRR